MKNLFDNRRIEATDRLLFIHQCVRESAAIYNAFGFESKDRERLSRALELLERSRLLLDQNTDPEISEQTIYGAIAQTYWGLGEADKAIEISRVNRDMFTDKPKKPQTIKSIRVDTLGEDYPEPEKLPER